MRQMRHKGESLGAGGSNFGVLGGFPPACPPQNPPNARLGVLYPPPSFLAQISPNQPQNSSDKQQEGAQDPIACGGTSSPKRIWGGEGDPDPPGPSSPRSLPSWPHNTRTPRLWGLSHFPSRDRVPVAGGSTMGPCFGAESGARRSGTGGGRNSGERGWDPHGGSQTGPTRTGKGYGTGTQTGMGPERGVGLGPEQVMGPGH